MAQMLIIIMTFVCYILVRKIKDNGGNTNVAKNMEHPIQEKVYKNKLMKKIVDVFMPKKGSKDYRKLVILMRESASKMHVEWLYVNKIFFAIGGFIITLFLCFQLHAISKQYVYTEPTSDTTVLGQMSDSDLRKAHKKTEEDNMILSSLALYPEEQVTMDLVETTVRYSGYYDTATDEQITTAADRILGKYKTVHGEYLQWFEVLIAFVIAVLAYTAPTLLLKFQKNMRQMEMEDEVMQFQTIILMLMKIERVNVEMILEWLERYSNIFREPISRCVNNYESGAWEALEELKNDLAYLPLIRIVESLQAAVEKIPIEQAFDELDTERAYYQEKRKEANERLIAKKGRIGKAIGFAPMIALFVGYIIVPLVLIGLLNMTSSFASMSTMM